MTGASDLLIFTVFPSFRAFSGTKAHHRDLGAEADNKHHKYTHHDHTHDSYSNTTRHDFQRPTRPWIYRYLQYFLSFKPHNVDGYDGTQNDCEQLKNVKFSAPFSGTSSCLSSRFMRGPVLVSNFETRGGPSHEASYLLLFTVFLCF